MKLRNNEFCSAIRNDVLCIILLVGLHSQQNAPSKVSIEIMSTCVAPGRRNRYRRPRKVCVFST